MGRANELVSYFQDFAKGVTTKSGFDKKILDLIHDADLVEGFYLAAMSEKAIGVVYFNRSEKFYA